ncbi:uncharacterized protein LOC121857270 [Homarus americanus]|nr:uncharacterized protein LOC121857270 [Homarus americanus]
MSSSPSGSDMYLVHPTSSLQKRSPPRPPSTLPQQKEEEEEAPHTAQDLRARGKTNSSSHITVNSSLLSTLQRVQDDKSQSVKVQSSGEGSNPDGHQRVNNGSLKYFIDDYKEMLGIGQEERRAVWWVRQQLHPPSTSTYHLTGVLNAMDDRYLSASQEFIGEQVQKLFNKSLSSGGDGRFAEAGAYDGEFLSNTLWLEMENKWGGVLVEPNPESFARLLKKGRKSWAINSCLSTTPYISTMAINLHVMADNVTQDIAADFWRSSSRARHMTPTKEDHKAVQAEVVCVPLYTILVATGLTSLDFLSLDVEFVEMGVLASLPWDKVDIKVLAIEHLTEEDLEAFLRARGYFLVAHQNEDWVFASNKHFDLHGVPIT